MNFRMGVVRTLVVAGLLHLLVGVAPAEAQWYRTYEAGVKAANSGQWAAAEKLLTDSVQEAERDDRRPGRSVLFYSQIRKSFLPDLYLAKVYANTGRFTEAAAALAKVRAAGWIQQSDAPWKDYQAIGQVVDAGLKKPTPVGNPTIVATNDPSKVDPGTEPKPPEPKAETRVPTPAEIDMERRRTQFATLIQEAQNRLAARRFVEARLSASSARGLNIDNPRADALLGVIEFELLSAQAETELGAGRFTDAKATATRARDLKVNVARADALLGMASHLEQAESQIASRRFADARVTLQEAGLGAERAAVNILLRRIAVGEAEELVRSALVASNATAARTAIQRLRSLDARNVKLPDYEKSVLALVSGDTQRQALLAFFRGDYRQAVQQLQPLAARADAQPRVHLYLACSNAALALLQGPDGASLLQTARAQYRKAQSGGPVQFAADRRFISPRILRSLEEAR